MLNIFLELWKAQQENQVVIPELNFPDIFILDENHDFIWLFRSKNDGKILRKKKLNSSVDTIVRSLIGQNQYQPIDQPQIKSTSSLQQIQPQYNILQPVETPYATYSRLNDQGEIEIQHFNSEQIKKFFNEVEYKNALPRDSIFLEKFLRADQNEIHNHFIKVVYNANFIQIEKRRNCFFWQNLTENSNRPRDREYYNCLVSYEGPDQFTEVEKINEYTANQLKYIVKQICIQLESIHQKERGRIKQISLIFKKINDTIYLTHCNEISFEKEQHIPKLWRMSFNNPFVVPIHIKCAPKPLVAQQNQILNKSNQNILNNQNKTQINPNNNCNKSSINQTFIDENNLKLKSIVNQQQQESKKTLENSKNNSENRLNQDQKLQMCSSCGQGCSQLQDVMKNKLLRIRIKRGVRENFNGLRPLYDTQQKQDKALFDKYTTVKVCQLCFTAYQEIQREDEQQQKQQILSKEAFGYSVEENSKKNYVHKIRSKSFNIVSLEQTNDTNTSLLNGQFLTPLEGSSFKRRKSVNQYQINESSGELDQSLLKKINDGSFQQRDQSFICKGYDNSFDQRQINKSFEQKQIHYRLAEKSIQQRLECMPSNTLNIEKNEESVFNINKRHHSLSKASQINPAYYQINKNLEFKFKELRSKSTHRSQNVSRILPNLQDQLNEDSLMNDISFIQKAHNLSSITPITANDQKTISEALNLLQDYKGIQKNNDNNSHRRVSRILPKSVGRQRPVEQIITPTMKQQYQLILQSANITPINLNDQSNSISSNNFKLNQNNKSTQNVITSYFNQQEDNHVNNNQVNYSHDEAFLKKFYQQQIIEKEQRQREQLIEVSSSINNSRDYISINHITNNQCLKSEDILNKMRDINSSKGMVQDSHEKIISDYNQIYKDQKYQVQLLKQKSNLGKVSTTNSTNEQKKIITRSRNSSAASKETNSTSNTQTQQRNNSNDVESRLLTNIRYLERQLQDSSIEITNDLSFDNQKENQMNIINQNSLRNTKQQQQSFQKFQLPPKSQKSIGFNSKIKIPITQNPQQQIQILNNKPNIKSFLQLPTTSNSSLSPNQCEDMSSNQSSKSLQKNQNIKSNINSSFDKPLPAFQRIRKIL